MQDKFTIFFNRILHASFPVNLLWYEVFGKSLLDPRAFINNYRCKYEDLIFYCPGGNTEVQFLKHHEPSVKAIISQVKGGDAVDVGASFGFYTLMLSRRVGEHGSVLSIEADPLHFGFLKRNIQINNRRNVIPLEMAAWSTRERLELTRHIFGGPQYDSSVSPAPQTCRYHVTGRPLDELVSEAGIHPRLVKIDVEGAEYEVLSGMQSILRLSRPVLIFEAQSQQRLSKCSSILRAFHYDVRPLRDRNVVAVPL